ncbi:MAG: response regulator [Candidatus Omnitrophica bacterium]|nr:response regulator [Candidatus Omnitrophota bacterium]
MVEEDKKTILVVEDNPLNMKLIVDLLELNDFIVLKADDGESALEILKRSLPDLILLDIQLPGMDGFELFRRIREDQGLDSVKVAALTALAMKEDEKKIMDAGFVAYIPKPIDTKAFIKEIKEIA